MLCIDDKPNGIILNHDGDWTGTARIAWYIASERRDPGPTPPSLCECWCVAQDLIAGRFTPTAGPPGEGPFPDPPTNVLTRAVALAVETYLCRKLATAIDDLSIPRGKLS